jgi:hypothetical protein
VPDHTPELGKPLDVPAHRDAVHVAIFAAYADTALSPGDRLEVTGERDGLAFKVRPVPAGGDAVVDPFLENPLPPGALFYALLRPGTITGLRHVYSHPKFRFVSPRLGPEDVLKEEIEVQEAAR